LTREIQRFKLIAVGCLITELGPFKVLKFQTAITPLLSDLRAMNLAPLDSSRQAASFEQKIFENLKKYFFANFAKIFI
jgi:hypothetical protein